MKHIDVIANDNLKNIMRVKGTKPTVKSNAYQISAKDLLKACVAQVNKPCIKK